MIFLFLSLISCRDESIFRSCNNMRFCYENLNKSNIWSINISTISFQNSTFEAELLYLNKNSGIKFQIYQLLHGGIRFKYYPIETEIIPRFDLSKEELVIYQEIINLKAVITHTNSNFKSILVCRNETTATIHYDPFIVEVKSAGKAVVTINADQNLIFEHHNETAIEETYGEYTDNIQGPTAVGIDFTFPYSNFSISGLSEHPTNMNIEDTINEPIRLYNTDGYEYKSGTNIHLYGSIPFLIGHNSEMTTGIYWINPSDTFINISSKIKSRKTRFLSESGYLDFIIYNSQFPNIISSYTSLTGKTFMPPIFSLGYHQCRWGYKSQEEVELVIRNLDDASIPFDCIWLDIDHLYQRSPFQFDYEYFPKPKDLINLLLSKHRYMVRLSDPHFPINSNWHKQSVEFSSNNLLVLDNKNQVFMGECWPGISIWPDFLNKKARDLWAKQYLYDSNDETNYNVFYWNDMNEPSIFDTDQSTFPKSCKHFGGYENRDVHNLYGLLNTVGTYQGLIERDNDHNRRPFVLTRSFFSGSQRYTWTWTGDNTASWDHLSLSIQMIINGGLSGMPFTGADVGGFFKSSTPALLARWFQVGSWIYPFFREHCHFESLRREPFLYEDEIFESIQKSILERYSLLPLWYTSTWICNQTGLPPVLPLWVEFPFEEIYHNINHEVLIGKSLLVCPVLNINDKVNIIKPPGIWYNYFNGKELIKNEIIESNILEIPVFIRGGKIISIFENPKENTFETLKQPICLLIALGEKNLAEGEIYLDDGETFNFMKGLFIHRLFKVSKGFLKNIKGSINSNFELYKNSYINKIIIFGAKNSLSNLNNSIFENNILTLNLLHLPLNEDWEIQIQ